MASAGDRKDREPSTPGSIWDSDEDGWAAAIDEWDKTLDLPQDAKEESAEDPEGAVTVPRRKEAAAGQDPLMEFMAGGEEGEEVDFAEGAGEALGSLLGSSFDEEPTPTKKPFAMPPLEEIPSDIGIDPDAVASAEVEIEVASEEPSKPFWEDQLTPVNFLFDEEQTRVADVVVKDVSEEVGPGGRPSEELIEEEPTSLWRAEMKVPSPAAPSREEEEKRSEEIALSPVEERISKSRLDVQALFENLDETSDPDRATSFPEESTPAVIRGLAEKPVEKPAEKPTDRYEVPQPVEKPTDRYEVPQPVEKPTDRYEVPQPVERMIEPASALLDILDEVDASSSTEAEHYADIELVEGGEVLPRPRVEEITAPTELPVELEPGEWDEAVSSPPAIPEELSVIDFSRLVVTAQAKPLVPPRSYWEKLIERLQLEAGLTDSSTRSASLEFAAARCCEELEESDEAIDHYREALNHRPNFVPAMRALRRIYTQRREFDQVVDLLRQMSERVGPEEKQAILSVLAEHLWLQLGDDIGARGILEELSVSTRQELRLLLLQLDIAVATQEESIFMELLSKIAETVTDAPIRSALYLELARVREARGEVEAAAASYHNAALAESGSAPAWEGLIRTGHSALLAEALGSSAAGSPRWESRRLRRRARLALEQRLDGIDPLTDLGRSSKLDPDDPIVLEHLAEARVQHGDLVGAITAYRDLARVVGDVQQKIPALVEAALLAEHSLRDGDLATTLYSEAAAIDETYPAVSEGIHRIQFYAADAQTRVEARRVAAMAAKGSLRAAHHLAAAILLADEIHDEPEATAELLACLEHEPFCRFALSRLERSYRQTGDFEKLAALFDTAAEATDNPFDAMDWSERAALLYEGVLRRPELALTRYRTIFESNPELTYARWGIIRSLASLSSPGELAQELSFEAAASVDHLRSAYLWTLCGHAQRAAGETDHAEASYRMALEKDADYYPATFASILSLARQGKWSEVGDRWSAWMERLPVAAPWRKALELRLAALRERELEDLPLAARTYEAAATTPNPVLGSVEGLRRVLLRMGGEEVLAEELDRELASTQDPSTRFALLMASGELANRTDSNRVEMKFRQALEEMPDHPLAIDALARHYSSGQAWSHVADLLLAELKEDRGSDYRVMIYEELAALDFRRGDEENARLSYESISELDPRHLNALRFLQHRYWAGKHWADLAGVMRREAERTYHASDTASIWIELGRLLIHPPEREVASAFSAFAAFGKDVTAKMAFASALEIDPKNLLALRHLLDITWSSGEEQELAQYYLRLAGLVGRGKESSVYLTRAGEILREEDFRSFREAMEHHPDNLCATYHLRDSALRSKDWETALFAAEAEGKTSRVVEHATSAYLLAGDIAQIELKDVDRSLRNYKAANEINPGHSISFERLQDFYSESGQWQQLAELLSKRCEIEPSTEKLVELHRNLAIIAKERLKQHDLAKKELRTLLTLGPDDLDSLSLLAEICYEDKEWPEAADALLRLARLEKNPIALRDLFFRLGRIYQEELPDSKRAIASFNKVITLDPSHLEALSRLSSLYLKEWDYKRALGTTSQLCEKEPNPERKVQHLLQIAKIYEDGLKDSHQAALSYRQALELAPADLVAIGELCGFFVRQSDQRSLMVHLDRSVATMRARLKHDPFETFAYRSLFKIFGWRKAPDGSLCAAQTLESLGELDSEEQEFIETHKGGVGSAGTQIGAPEHDEWLFDRSIPGGFRQVFQFLVDPFLKMFPGDIRSRGGARSDRVTHNDHPVRRVGDALARDFGVSGYDLYILKSNPTALFVENTNPAAILIGNALVADSTEEEIQFLMGRCLWIIRKAMILPTHLVPEELEILVAGVVRQYAPEFQPVDAALPRIQDATKQVTKAISRKIRGELSPYALECSNPSLDLRSLGAAVTHSANRAGLLACRSPYAAMTMLRKMSGRLHTPQSPADRVKFLQGNIEAEELLRFSVADAHFELRRAMHIGIR